MEEKMLTMRNTPSLLVGVQTCVATLEITMVFLRKLKINLPQVPAIPLKTQPILK